MSNFEFNETKLAGVYTVDVKCYGDERGYFMETYKKEDFVKAGLDYDFVQDNQSSSRKGTLRGLHFQKKHPQAKLVRVINGEVFDVVVDLRKNSPTYGMWEGFLLSGKNKRQLLVPRGFAHGFLALSDIVEFAYKCDDYYHPEDESGIIWNDPQIGVEWQKVGEYIISEKDRKLPTLKELDWGFDI